MKCDNMLRCGCGVAKKILCVLDALSPLSLLAIRLWVANVFYQSAVNKLPAGFLGVGQGNWDATLFLFEHEHPVPGLSPEVAAYVGTGVEFLAPIFLALGLGGRAAAVALLAMTVVIEFTYQHNAEHIIWAIFLGTILLQGPGKLSLDHLIRRKCMGSKA